MSLNLGTDNASTYDTADNITFMDPRVASEFVCAICLGPPKEARLACLGQHFFCNECLSKHCSRVENCPTCRGELLNTGEGYGANASYFERALGELGVKCMEGCGESFKFKDMKLHQKTCPESIQVCPFNKEGCVCTVKRKDMEHHLKEYAVEHIGMQCRSVQESAFDTNAAVEGMRKMIIQSYNNMGVTYLDNMKAILDRQYYLNKRIDHLETNLAGVYNAVGDLASFLAESHSKIIAALPGHKDGFHTPSDDFVNFVECKAEHTKRKANQMKRCRNSSLEPGDSARPGAPEDSLPEMNLVAKLPRLRQFRGLFSDESADEEYKSTD